MNLSKWFIRSEEIFLIKKNLYLLNLTSDIMNDFETDDNNNYWKYRSFEEIKQKLKYKYKISQYSFVVIYTNDKLMMAARFAWLLYWIGYDYVKIAIGNIDASLIIKNSLVFRSILLKDRPLRREVRLICEELFDEFLCSTTKLIDTRTYEEYSGQITGYSYVYRAGRIPNFEYDPLDGIYDKINGDLTWDELEKYLKLFSKVHSYDKNIKRIVYMCGTGWRASLAGIFADILNLAETITVLDSGWYEWSERFLEN